jgi:Uma2 family endonuclease
MNAIHTIRRIPPLQNGDRLRRDEFERRYDAMPHVKAELIDGVVFMASPVRATQHGEPHLLLCTCIGVYCSQTPHTHGADNATVRLSDDDEPQPDAAIYIEPDHGGQVRLDDGYITGPPELVAEISVSTVSLDAHAKPRLYARHGIREYMLWRVEDDAIDWFTLHDGAYRLIEADAADGLLKSRIFPGLWLDAPALLRRDMPAVLAALQRGLASPEHAAFVTKLRMAAGPSGQ